MGFSSVFQSVSLEFSEHLKKKGKAKTFSYLALLFWPNLGLIQQAFPLLFISNIVDCFSVSVIKDWHRYSSFYRRGTEAQRDEVVLSGDAIRQKMNLHLLCPKITHRDNLSLFSDSQPKPTGIFKIFTYV